MRVKTSFSVFGIVVAVAQAVLFSALSVSCGKSERAGAKSDSIAMETDETEAAAMPDLSLYDLKGDVETVEIYSSYVTPESSGIVEIILNYHDGLLLSKRETAISGDFEHVVDDLKFLYDSDGVLTGASNKTEDGDIRMYAHRDEGGYMMGYGTAEDASDMFQCRTDYFWEDGLPVKEVYADSFGSRTVTNTYTDGVLTGRKVAYATEEGNTVEKYIYNYKETDQYGNWTKRDAEVTIEEHLTEAARTDRGAQVQKYPLSESRKIKYKNNQTAKN